MKYQYLCLPVQSDQPMGCCPDAYLIAIDRITLGLKDLLENAARLLESQAGFRHIEIDFDAGTWVKLDDATADYDVFQEADPVKAGWASEYNHDDMASSPVDGFSAQADGFGNLEFRCYAADTGIYLWSDPVHVDRDRHLVTFGNRAYNMLTGELTENQRLGVRS